MRRTLSVPVLLTAASIGMVLAVTAGAFSTVKPDKLVTFDPGGLFPQAVAMEVR